MAKRSELRAAQRREALLALLRREKSAAVLARRLGIAERTLYRWRDEWLALKKTDAPVSLDSSTFVFRVREAACPVLRAAKKCAEAK